ncbi:MAG: hypothetical protein RL662_355 [Bacteroidota bacterium]|jgi:FkbM family methyltransferase
MIQRVTSLAKLIKKYIKQHYFPSEQDKSIQRWRADNGDKNLIPVHDLDENSLVLDVGGFHGDFAAEIYARYSCYIKVFEPVPSFAQYMRLRFEKNNKIDIYQIGLGGHTSTENMSVNSVSSSTLRSVSDEQIQIQIVGIVEWLETSKIDKVALLKINIEGGEYDLLEKLLDSKFIANINEIQIQFHNFVPNATQRMLNIQKKIAQTHMLTFQYTFIWENWVLKA